MNNEIEIKQPELKIIESLKNWKAQFKERKLEILKSLLDKNKSLEEIVSTFVYQNLKAFEPDFCPLFKKSQLCHKVSEEKLYCYACDCPHYQFSVDSQSTEGKIVIGRCLIQSKKAKHVPFKKETGSDSQLTILDCSDCIIPHTHHSAEKEIQKFIELKD